MELYLRKVRVTLQGSGGGVTINPGNDTDRQLKVSFNIAKGISGTANEANDIEIWNLSEEHRNAIGKEFDHVTLEAGYTPPSGGSNVGIIFRGNLRDVAHPVEHTRDGADIITRISCGDGDKALRKATMSKTFPAGSKVRDIVEEVQKQFEAEGVARGEWKGLDDLPPYKRPYSVCGSCAREMERLGRSHDLYWSIQNETLEIIPGDGFIESAVLLTPDTGLIGVPTITDNGVQAVALLNPEIRPNRKVVIQSETLEMNSEGGAYRVSAARYYGDNRNGSFHVVIDGERIEGGKVDEGVKG